MTRDHYKGDPASTLHDVVDGRKGQWMQTSLGGQFFPVDCRPNDIRISDIANGLAMDCRYAGQIRIDRYYSVAEHSFHIAQYAATRDAAWPPDALLCALLHDASEAYINDLPRAVKHGIGPAYTDMEEHIQSKVWEHFSLERTAELWADDIKALDRRIVPVEKAAIMRYPQPWAFDVFEPLANITIHCWMPQQAKRAFLDMYRAISQQGGFPLEEYEI